MSAETTSGTGIGEHAPKDINRVVESLAVGTQFVGTPRRVDTRAAVAWLQRQIAFQDRPLDEVADEFNGCARIKIVIDDQDLRALPISGAFDAYDMDSFSRSRAGSRYRSPSSVLQRARTDATDGCSP